MLQIKEFYIQKNNVDKFLELDNAFHKFIYEIANKKLCYSLIKMVNIPLKDTARTLNNARLIQKWKDAVKNFKDRANFKSELDWSPESWFSTRPNYIGYTKEDAIELAKHIPEYHKIERIAKANGTWLKMPDGTTWPGDPRSWVQKKKKNV